MPSDAAISPIAAVAPAPPAARAAGSGEAPSFAALIEIGVADEAALPVNLIPPGFADALPPAETTVAAPAARPTGEAPLMQPIESPPQPQDEATRLPDLAMTADPARTEPAAAPTPDPTEAGPDEDRTANVADAGDLPAPAHDDPAAPLAQAIPLTTQAMATTEPRPESAETSAEEGLDGVHGARLARGDRAREAQSDTPLASEATGPASDAAPIESTATKPGTHLARTVPPSSAMASDEPAGTKPAPPAATQAADRPGAAVNLALRTLYQAPPSPAAAPPPGAPLVQAHGGQLGRDVGAVIRREIVSGREDVVIRLDPPELGRVHIRLSFETAGQLRAVVATESPAALDLLRRDVNQLDRALADAGVQTDAQSFQFDNRQAGSGFGRPPGNQGGSAPSQSRHPSAERDDHLPVRQALHGRMASGRVDMIA